MGLADHSASAGEIAQRFPSRACRLDSVYLKQKSPRRRLPVLPPRQHPRPLCEPRARRVSWSNTPLGVPAPSLAIIHPRYRGALLELDEATKMKTRTRTRMNFVELSAIAWSISISAAICSCLSDLPRVVLTHECRRKQPTASPRTSALFFRWETR